MIVYRLFLVFFSVFLSQNVSSMAFSALTSKDSELWRACSGTDFARRIEYLADLSQPTSPDEYTCVITGVPALDGTSATITSELRKEYPHAAEHAITFFDAQRNECLWGTFTEAEAYLGSLRTTPAPHSIMECGPKRSVSGTVVLTIWDYLWQLCGCKRARLVDDACYGPFTLRILLPYVHGHSWYGKFGYQPRKKQIQKYYEAVEFLKNRPFTAVIADFKGNTKIYSMLREIEQFIALHNPTLGMVTKELYDGMRRDDRDYADRCAAYLHMLYDSCLKAYNTRKPAPALHAALTILDRVKKLEKRG